MSTLRLPPDLERFLREKQELVYDPADCEVGKVSLEWIEDLELSTAHVDLEESPLAETDPNAGKSGQYEIPCVSLLFDCQNYYPWGVLCWFPNEKQYGTVDSDHNDVFLFGPQVGWADILRDPVRWLNYQWREKDRRYFSPHPHYPFVEGNSDFGGAGSAAALRDAKDRYDRMKKKYLRRGIEGETEQLSNIRSVIEALEFTMSLPKAEPRRSKPEPETYSPASDLSAILEQSFAKLEAAMQAAPKEQQAAFEEKLRLLRGQIQAFKQKHQPTLKQGGS
jgi:hypothetical protein